MKSMLIDYVSILKYKSFLEREIEHIADEYRELCWKRTETLKAINGDRFSKNYGIDDDYFSERCFSLRIRQFETFDELRKLTTEYYEQTGDTLSRNILIRRSLINFRPGYDDFDYELNKMRDKRGW